MLSPTMTAPWPVVEPAVPADSAGAGAAAFSCLLAAASRCVAGSFAVGVSAVERWRLTAVGNSARSLLADRSSAKIWRCANIACVVMCVRRGRRGAGGGGARECPLCARGCVVCVFARARAGTALGGDEGGRLVAAAEAAGPASSACFIRKSIHMSDKFASDP